MIVTHRYFLSPYGVRPHPQFQLDMEKFIEKNRPVDDTEGRWVENWTKWKLQLGGERGPIILPHQRLSLENLSLPASAVFEWRSDYQADLVETKEGDLEVVIRHPVASVGLYHHYNVKVESGKHVIFTPVFMFGVQQQVLDQMYGGPDGIPTIGKNFQKIVAFLLFRDYRDDGRVTWRRQDHCPVLYERGHPHRDPPTVGEQPTRQSRTR